jgi:hypothetical protein
MIEAYAAGFPVRVAPYGARDPVGFTRPWAKGGSLSTTAAINATVNPVVAGAAARRSGGSHEM